MRFKQIGIPSGKLTVCYGKRPISFDGLLMKHDKHGDFSWFPMGFPWFSIAMFWVPIHLSRPTQGPNGTLPQLLKHIPWPSARPSRRNPDAESLPESNIPRHGACRWPRPTGPAHLKEVKGTPSGGKLQLDWHFFPIKLDWRKVGGGWLYKRNSWLSSQSSWRSKMFFPQIFWTW